MRKSNNDKKIRIYGAGGHSQVIKEVLILNEYSITETFDDKPLNIHHASKNVEIGLRNNIKNFPHDGDPVIIAIGNNHERAQIASFLNSTFGKAIHQSAIISSNTKVGQGTVVFAGAIIQPNTIIGKHVIVNTGASIDHDNIIEDFAHISPKAALCGHVTVGKGSHVGVGALIIPKVNIGKWCTIGAGTVVLKDIPDYCTVVGNPAKIIKHCYSDVCFIGSGISSSFTLLNFLNELESFSTIKQKIKISILEKYSEFNTGIPYGNRSGYSTLLITSLKDFLIEGERIKFVKWLNNNKIWLLDEFKKEGSVLTNKWLQDYKEQIDNNDWDDLFIPRRFFGVYINEILKEKIKSLTDKDLVEVNYILGEAIDIEKSDNDYKISLKNSSPYFSKKVVLSVGSLPTKHLWKNKDLIKKDNLLFLNKPYLPELKQSLEKINGFIKTRENKETNILIVGANASALELIYKINDEQRSNKNLKFTFLSTHGKLPDDKPDFEKSKKYTTKNLNLISNKTDLCADEIAKATYADIKNAEKMNLGAASTVGIISKAFGGLLNKLNPEELERFACLYGNDIGRHQRCAGPHYINNIRDLEAKGHFYHIAGKFLDLKDEGNRNYFLKYLETSTKTEQLSKTPFHIVINCVGGQNLKDKNTPSLIKNIISNGLCKPNNSNIGFHVNEYLEATKNIYVMGPLLAGNVIENKAVWHVEHCGRIIWLSKILAKCIFNDITKQETKNNYKLEVKDLKSASDIDGYQNLLIEEWGNNIYYSIKHIKYFENKDSTLKYFLFSKENKPIIVMPFILRKIKIGKKVFPYYDVVTPYGYGGPLFNDKKTEISDLKSFWLAIDEWYSENKIITEFIRFNLNNNFENYTGHLIPTLNNVRGVLKSFDELWGCLKQKVRNNYRKAVKNNLRFEIFHNPIEDNIIEEFYTIFVKTMERNGAKKDYFYTKTYFKEFIGNHENDTYIAIIYNDNIPISAELIISTEDTIYSYLGGTISEYFNMRPNDFLKIEVMKWAITNGKKYYVLGGGRGNNDSLYKYKKTFFPKDKDAMFYTGRKIINHDIYNSLARNIEVDYDDILSYVKDSSTYFPIYNQDYFKKINSKDFKKLLNSNTKK